MCGIVGYIGEKDSKEVLLKGLEKLEYRGYDSAGIAVVSDSGIQVFKEKGRIADLRKVVDTTVKAHTGIGHTRWATHGVPNKTNSHPHQSMSKRFTVVHNGVIENYMHLKEDYLPENTFLSETDTEVLAHMVEKFVQDGLEVEQAFIETLKLVHGSYALSMLDSENEDVIYVAKNKSPLLIGLGDNFNVVSSDAMAMIQITNKFVEINDQEIVLLTKDSFTIKDLKGNILEREHYIAELDASDVEKGTYPHYMLKEIDEQPLVIRNIMMHYQNDYGQIEIDKNILLNMRNSDRIYIIACGTSYHAGLIGKQYIENLAGIPTEVHIASEFVYNMPLLSKNPFFIFISQSGETADSRAVLVKIKGLKHRALTITNVPGSTLSREADFTLALHAGPEIAVASTKAYTAQIAVLLLLSCAIGQKLGKNFDFDPIHQLSIVANAMETLCNEKEEFENIATNYLQHSSNAFFIGRHMDYFVSLESALKLKEISYIQTEGFAGGELKHGTIALIEEGTAVFAFNTQKHVNLSIRGNVKEVSARGANVCVISMEGLEQEGDTFVLPQTHEILSPLVSIIPSQLIAYYASLHRGNDVDKPRNLAKSVTVE